MDPGPTIQDTASVTTVTVHTSPSEAAGELATAVTNVSAAAPDWSALLAATAAQTVTDVTTVAAGAGVTITQNVVETEAVQSGDWLTRINKPRFYNNGKYVTGYVDSTESLLKLLEDYQTLTGTQFPNIQQLSLATKATEQEYLQQRFLTPSARPRLFWQMHSGEPVIPFDGVPFISVGQGTEIPCVLAGKRKTTTQVLVATGDVLPTKIRTQGCSAKMSIRRILRYPSARLPTTGVQGITAMRRLRKQALEVLTAKVCAGLVKPVERFYLSLPTPLCHDSHTVPEMEDPPSLIEPVHEEILRHIGQGITSVNHIDTRIRKFVETAYGNDPSININDPTFIPTRYDLARYIYWLYRSGRAVDQECPFRERYNILNEDSYEKEEAPEVTSPLGQVTSSEQTKSNHTEDLTNIYNIVLGESGDIELSGPQVGAEETTATASTQLTQTITPVHHQPVRTPTSVGSRIVAAPKSNIFSETDQSTAVSIQQTQSDVCSMLQILENQTYACNDSAALNTLRRQLTFLCTEFSMHLAGNPRRSSESPLTSDPKRPKLT